MARRTKKRRGSKLTPKEIRRRRKTRREQQRLLIGAAVVIAAILLIIGFGYYRENIAAARAPVAVVNGETITTEEYQQMVSYQQFNLITNLGNQIDQQTLMNFLQNQLPQTVLQSMIDQVFIEQKAAEADITVTDEEVQRAIEQRFGFTGDTPTPTAAAGDAVTNPVPADSVTREEFNAAFTNYMDALETQAGLSESEYYEIIQEELLREKVRQQIAADVPAEAPQVHARHILVETEEEAKEARQRLMDGEDFATVAKEVSTDSQSAEKGGDLGWFPKGEMVPEFEEVAFNAPIGEISQPIKSQFGYHIIEVLERDENRPLSPSQLQQARQDRFRQWLQEQQAAADIQRKWTPDVVPTLPVAPNPQSAPPTPSQ